MECLERQLDKFPELPEEVEEDIDRVVAEFYRNELEENEALERAVDRIYSEEDYDEVDKENIAAERLLDEIEIYGDEEYYQVGRAVEKINTEDEKEKELKLIEEIIREESPVAESKPKKEIFFHKFSPITKY